MLPLQQFLETSHAAINPSDLIALLDTSQNQCMFIKDKNSLYCYANANFIHLMGLNHLKQLRQFTDHDLSKHKKDTDLYRELDTYVLEEEQTLPVSEVIMPAQNQPIVKTMHGKLCPLYFNSNKANYVLGLVTPESKLLKLDFDTLFNLTHSELSNLLIKRSYRIRFTYGLTTLSKMEIRVIVELLKGSHAGNTACALGIKQSTVESYLANIKNKLAVTTKSELIHLIIKEKILEQIIL